MIKVAVYDTKPYDREFLSAAYSQEEIRWEFHEYRLSAGTSATAHGADVVCVFVNDQVDRACLEQLAGNSVRLVALRCAGFNNVDIPAAKSLGILVVRVPAYSPHAVAEHAVGMLLTLRRKIHRAFNRVRELNFSLNGLVGGEIYGKTAGIIGTGRIGRIVAEIFRGFQAEVLAYDPFPAAEWGEAHGVNYLGLEEVLRQSDILSLHVPLLPETAHLLNTQTIGMLKKGVTIINTSRGKLIDTAALVRGLKSGLIGGVALDVYEEEEGVFFEDLSGQVLLDDTLSRLLTFPNVLVTSHQGFLTAEGLSEIARITVSNICAFGRGEKFMEGTRVGT